MSEERRVRENDDISVMSARDIMDVTDSKERIFLRNLRATIVDVESAQMRREEKEGTFEERSERAHATLKSVKKTIANLKREKETGEVTMTQNEIDLRDRLEGIRKRYEKYMNSELEEEEGEEEGEGEEGEEEGGYF